MAELDRKDYVRVELSVVIRASNSEDMDWAIEKYRKVMRESQYSITDRILKPSKYNNRYRHIDIPPIENWIYYYDRGTETVLKPVIPGHETKPGMFVIESKRFLPNVDLFTLPTYVPFIEPTISPEIVQIQPAKAVDTRKMTDNNKDDDDTTLALPGPSTEPPMWLPVAPPRKSPPREATRDVYHLQPNADFQHQIINERNKSRIEKPVEPGDRSIDFPREIPAKRKRNEEVSKSPEPPREVFNSPKNSQEKLPEKTREICQIESIISCAPEESTSDSHAINEQVLLNVTIENSRVSSPLESDSSSDFNPIILCADDFEDADILSPAAFKKDLKLKKSSSIDSIENVEKKEEPKEKSKSMEKSYTREVTGKPNETFAKRRKHDRSNDRKRGCDLKERSKSHKSDHSERSSRRHSEKEKIPRSKTERSRDHEDRVRGRQSEKDKTSKIKEKYKKYAYEVASGKRDRITEKKSSKADKISPKSRYRKVDKRFVIKNCFFVLQ